MKLRRDTGEDPDINVSSLIDMTFLLLVYFMATAVLVRSEADLGIKLPGMLAQAQTVEMTDEQTVEVYGTGSVMLNGQVYDDPRSVELPQLTRMLERYKLASQAAKTEALVTVWAEDDARHQRVIDVLNACAKAGISNVTFSATGK